MISLEKFRCSDIGLYFLFMKQSIFQQIRIPCILEHLVHCLLSTGQAGIWDIKDTQELYIDQLTVANSTDCL